MKIVFAATLVLTIAVITDRPGLAAPSKELTGGMMKLSYLLGSWSCRDSKSGQPLYVTTFLPTFENTIHEHSISSSDETDEYFGWSPTAHYYYVAMVDSGGSYAYGVSTDGINFSQTIRNGFAIKYKTDFSFQPLSYDTWSVHSEATINGMKVPGDSICSRQGGS